MRESWRWFGPADPVSLDAVRQTGATGIVTALHHLPPGAVWTRGAVAERCALIAGSPAAPTGLEWAVVESLPVSEDIKRQTGEWRAHLEAWTTSLEAIAASGIEVVCYNFMPVLDWTRTDLAHALPGGATCMRFDLHDFAAFDIHLLERPGTDYPEEVREEAERRFAGMDDEARAALTRNVVCGLPGAADTMTMADVRYHLALYDGIDADRLRRHLAAFLEHAVPAAERLGLRLCCHPDDPPWPLLGLPRIVSGESDYAALTSMVDSPSNGIAFCTGSLGADGANDLAGMMRRLGGKVHFLHLRNVARDAKAAPSSFHESGHLQGDVDMIGVIEAVMEEEARRRADGRADHSIPFRPDHGLHMTDDQARDSQPGYPLVGRHVGLAELRGVVATLARREAEAGR